MLKKTTIDRLKALGIDPDKLKEAITAEAETDFDLPEGSLYTDESIAEMKTRVKEGHEKAYPEIYGKQLNEKYSLGLSTTDAKNPEKLIEALQKKAVESAGIEPNKKVQELQESLKRLQETTIPELQRTADEWKGKYTERAEFDSYASVIPEDANKYLTKDEHVARVKARLKIGENGEAIDMQTGQAIKDKLEKPVMFKDAVAELYKTNETWREPASAGATPGGRQFTHATKGNPGRKAGEFDHDGTLQRLSEQHDQNTPEGRQAIRTAMASEMAAHQQAAA